MSKIIIFLLLAASNSHFSARDYISTFCIGLFQFEPERERLLLRTIYWGFSLSSGGSLFSQLAVEVIAFVLMCISIFLCAFFMYFRALLALEIQSDLSVCPLIYKWCYNTTVLHLSMMSYLYLLYLCICFSVVYISILFRAVKCGGFLPVLLLGL